MSNKEIFGIDNDIPREIYNEIHKHEPLVIQHFTCSSHSNRMEVTPNTILTTRHNHRKIAIPEVVFDIDCHILELCRELWNRISDNLTRDNISHTVWNTSRSYHIHTYFKDLENLPYETRKALKKHLLRHYSEPYTHWVDRGKCSENVMIRDFNTNHEVTGKPKKLIFNFNQDKSVLNPIKPEILNDFWEKHKTLNLGLKVNPRASNKVETPFKQAYETFLEFAQNTPFVKSGMGKNNFYFKNIAIATFKLGMSKQEAKIVFNNVARQCKPHKADAMLTWYDWCKNQKRDICVNWKEVRPFYEKEPILEEDILQKL